jgi:hypothetical protein
MLVRGVLRRFVLRYGRNRKAEDQGEGEDTHSASGKLKGLGLRCMVLMSR